MTLPEELGKALVQKTDFAILVPAAQAGDKAARDALMTAYYGWSVTQARKTIRDSERARNVAVEFWAWMFADNGIRDYDSERAGGNFHAWMAMRIRALALNAVEKPQPKLMYSSTVQDPEDFNPDHAISVGAMQDLEAVAKALPSAQHKDVFWRLLEGATAQEIAEEINVSVKRARNLIGEVREAIRKQTGDDDEA